jgi:predicted Zn-dependent protease
MLAILLRRLAIPTLTAALASTALTGPPVPQEIDQSPANNPGATGKRDIGKGINLYSIEREQALGKQLAREIARSGKVLDEVAATEYVNRLAEKIAQNSDAVSPIVVRLLISDEPNSIVLPGGYIFINSGLILRAPGEAGLAAVLAHGIAHMALRSGTKIATRAELTQIALIPAIIYIPTFGWTGLAVHQSQNFIIPLTILKSWRDAQLAADHFGVQYLYRAGYAPEQYILMLERAQDSTTVAANPPKVFGRDLPLADRVRLIQEEISKSLKPRDGAIVSTPEFDALQKHMREQLPN